MFSWLISGIVLIGREFFKTFMNTPFISALSTRNDFENYRVINQGAKKLKDFIVERTSNNLKS